MNKTCPNPVSIGYCPGPTYPGAEAFFANIRAWRTRYPLILFSEHKWDADTVLLRASPDVMGDETHRHKKSNLIFLTALRILRGRGFSHFIYLEADCRVAQQEWDGRIVDEAFADGETPLMAGSVMAHNMSCHSMAWTRRFNQFIARNAGATFPIPCYSHGRGAAEPGEPCLFVNGALGLYDLTLLLQWFAPYLADGASMQAARDVPAWDVFIGRKLFETFPEELFLGLVKNLDCCYSGYGNVQSTEAERLDWLVTGRAVAVHQVKSGATGPLSKGDLRLQNLEAGEGTDKEQVEGVTASRDVATATIHQLATDAGHREPEPEPASIPSAPRMDIFIVTFAPDIRWLKYCLLSIAKFCTGFGAVHVAYPNHDTEAFEALHESLGELPIPLFWHGYDEAPAPLAHLDHNIRKCSADLFCPDADLIAHFDSDCFVREPMTPNDYLVDGKPVLLLESYEHLKMTHPGRYFWKSAVDATLQVDSKWEGMCRHPAVHWRGLYPLMRERVEQVHGKSFTEYVLSCKPDRPCTFCEFNTLATYAHGSKFFKDKYHFIDVTDHISKRPHDKLLQFWSRQSPEKEQEIWIGGILHKVVPSEIIKGLLLAVMCVWLSGCAASSGIDNRGGTINGTVTTGSATNLFAPQLNIR